MTRDTGNRRIEHLTLDETTVRRSNAQAEHERAVAIHDLIEENFFDPRDCPEGPYRVTLSVAENRLIFDISDAGDRSLSRIPLAVLPFRRLIREYLMVCDSYFEAIKTSSPGAIETIDMGRRGIHDSGAELMVERLGGKIDIDHNTARRLFTLLCVLHLRL